MNKNVLYIVGTSGSGKTSLARLKSADSTGSAERYHDRHASAHSSAISSSASPKNARDALGEGLLVVLLWAHPQNVRERLTKRGYNAACIDHLLTEEVAELNGFAEYAREDALRADWVGYGPTASAQLRYRFAVCRNDTYWDRSQIIDFIEQEVDFD